MEIGVWGSMTFDFENRMKVLDYPSIITLQVIQHYYNFSIGRIVFVLSYVQSSIKIFIFQSKTLCIRHTVAYVECPAQPANRIPSMYHLAEFMFVVVVVVFWVCFGLITHVHISSPPIIEREKEAILLKPQSFNF